MKSFIIATCCFALSASAVVAQDNVNLQTTLKIADINSLIRQFASN